MILNHTAAIRAEVRAPYTAVIHQALHPKGSPPPPAPIWLQQHWATRRPSCLDLQMTLSRAGVWIIERQQCESKGTDMERTSSELVTVCGSPPLLGTELLDRCGQIFINFSASSLSALRKLCRHVVLSISCFLVLSYFRMSYSYTLHTGCFR